MSEGQQGTWGDLAGPQQGTWGDLQPAQPSKITDIAAQIAKTRAGLASQSGLDQPMNQGQAILSELQKNFRANPVTNAVFPPATNPTTGHFDPYGVERGAPMVPQGVKAVTSGVADAINAIPSTARAGSKFDQIMKVAKDVPIDTTKAEDIAARAQDLKQRGSSMPKVLSDFIKNRMSTQPLTYAEGRDFASNASALSAKDVTRINAKMQSQVTQFSAAMRDANRDAAAKAGMGDLYDQAMKEYSQAKGLSDKADIVKKWAAYAGIGALLGATGKAGYRLYEQLSGR